LLRAAGELADAPAPVRLAHLEALPTTMRLMRRWLAAAVVTCLLVGCSQGAPPSSAPAPSDTARPTPSGPQPTLPLARAIPATPSPDAALPAAAIATTRAAAHQAFVLQSSAFAGGATLPPEFTCDGADMSPPLAWSGAPPGTAAYALIEQDTDVHLATEPFTQWLVYNMPRTINQLAPGQPARPLLPNGSQQGQNGNSSIGYFGPCPNRGDPPHHLNFDLFAQDGYVTLETGASIDGVRTALQGHVVGQTQLQALVQR
jgi:Raf kinase inhibitor-like YbhB/YbcL family protein